MSAPLAALEGVTLRFAPAGGGPEVTPLADVDLAVDAGESVAVVGPSGAGKTTLLHVLGGLLPPTTGVVRFDGRDLSTLDERALAALRNERIGFVFQQHNLLPQCTVLENLLVPTLVRHRRTPAALVDRARELLARVGLSERADHRPGELSGGECQRVAVARALVLDPDLLLADEPTGALDGENAERLADLLVELNAEREVALVTVTHWPELAHRMRRRLALREGSLRPADDGGADGP
ncbi:MAG: ABC transporter ATP-binding protein [Planctomycetota bacterium JB042]